MKFAVVFFFMAISSCFEPSTALKLNIKTECLQKLLQTDLPQTLIRVHDLLCLYVQGKDAHNEVLYKRFLKELNEVLKDAGCTLDELLNTKNALETLGDEIGKVADEVAFEILKTVDDLEITGKVLDLGCQLVGKTLISLSDALSKLNVLPVKNVVGKVLKL